jgi:predicted amidohydrolase
MSRDLRVAAAQLGPVALADSRADVVERMIDLLRDAAGQGAQLVAFPELALTTFFPRWWFDDQHDIDAFFEREMPSADTKPLYDEARHLGMGFSLGFAELVDRGDGTHGTRHYNTTVLIDQLGHEVARYRKIHLPGHSRHEPDRPFQHLERAYFDPGPEPFAVHQAFGGLIGLATCNDRRWPESYRVLGLQGVELILIGYNTPVHYPPDPSQDRLAGFHNNLVMASGAYENGTFVVGVAKGGLEEGVESLAESQIIGPSGEVLAQAETAGDQIVIATCDLDLCDHYKKTLFDFDRYRRPEMYGLITHTPDPGRRP